MSISNGVRTCFPCFPSSPEKFTFTLRRRRFTTSCSASETQKRTRKKSLCYLGPPAPGRAGWLWSSLRCLTARLSALTLFRYIEGLILDRQSLHQKIESYFLN